MKISLTIAVTILSVLALTGYANHSVASSNPTENYQQITISKKLFDLLTEKKVDKINAIVATDDVGTEIYIDLAAIEDFSNDTISPLQENQVSVSAAVAATAAATCPPLYPTEPTNCIWIGWKAASNEGGQYLPYHCHCYR